jgi:soluble lytic murein transglycosylase-like protein
MLKNQQDLDQSRLHRIARHDGIVADFSGHHEPLQKILEASEQNLRLAQTLRVQKKQKYEPWQLIAQTARFFNSQMTRKEAQSLAQLILRKADKHRVDPLLMTALISQESAFRSRAQSQVGAYGYGQLMPDTADFLGVDRTKPEENLEGCAKYLGQQLRRWSRSKDPERLALASYNAGPGAVAHYRGVPPYRETRAYVNIVTARYATLKEASATQMKSGQKLVY